MRKRVFVTGGTSYVGRTLVPELLAQGREVSVLTRDPSRVPEAFSKVAVVRGDLRDASSYGEALARADSVVHAALSSDLSSGARVSEEIAATDALLERSAALGLRFVHLSTTSVYGITPPGVLDEAAPRRETGERYVSLKIRQEESVLRGRSGLEAVVLQLANVHGPGGGWWSGTLPDLMRRGKVLLVDGGAGTANLVHVLDVAQAVGLALDAPAVSGERFLVTDGKPVPWRDYFSGLERLLGRKATLPLSAEEAKRLSRALVDRSPVARAGRFLARALLGRPIVFPLEDAAIDRFSSKTTFSIEKARRVLRYEPRLDLARGLETLAPSLRTS